MENRLSLTHAGYMRRALALAARAQGRTSPNPAVGAVVVNGGRIVGEGFHRGAGTAHAETEALRRAGPRARGSTLYVTLEPCNHVGRTGKCCDAILDAGVSRVVMAMKDPNPITNGRGRARLRGAGVDVKSGVLASEALKLNAPFVKAMRTGLPLVIAKMGQSLDGKIATAARRSRWITSAGSRRLGHGLRGQVDAVLVGVGTVVQDDPRLTARGHGKVRQPLRVIVDSRLRAPLSSRCFRPGTLVATTAAGGRKRAALAARGVEVVRVPARRGRVALEPLFRRLVERGVRSVLIEGGGELLAGALEERLVDRVVFFIAPVLIGGREAPTSVEGRGAGTLSKAVRVADLRVRPVGPDVCVEGRVVYPR
jgi:diaminohydroxyphosphoribosylaminopyrimidine deaminase/5-amino-6-(5-phosphoribosylamino)uracil reductase